VAWRLRPAPGGGAMMIHQEASNAEINTDQGGYSGGPCKSAMGAAVTTFPEASGASTSAQLIFTVLPIDFALSSDGARMAVVAAGNANGAVPGGGQVLFVASDQLVGPDCVFPPPPGPDATSEATDFRQPIGEAIAVAFDGTGRVVVQTREPARVEILTRRGGTIKLSDESRFDTGHAVFHAATAFGLACASCHPEGGEDGRVWHFSNLGPRRTQSLRGGIGETAPFHWDGKMRDFGQLMTDVFTGRMGGPALATGHVQALSAWVEKLPRLPALTAADAPAAVRGRALFEDPRLGCATCHGGALSTNNATVSVGTGEALQVPSLRGVGWRAPYMHTGCAPTLADRFDPLCGGDQHGMTSGLSRSQIQDLTAYLDSL
jgi:mono/diheme cytochrome c family protein